jgi:pimeloyl-ACP methyl ester carboxylesterase
MSLHVHETGSPNAPTIVFLHALGLSSWMWTDQINELQKDYHCLAIDLPGNGESYQTEWHSFADTAAQVATIIRAKASSGKAHVVGLSLGGFTA